MKHFDKNETSDNKLLQTHHALTNGQGKQAAEMINEYGRYDFFTDYKYFLVGACDALTDRHKYFTDMVTSYFHIMFR